ncbi:ferredoxin [Anaerocolumna sp. AGMB13025]|uniref:ferredoxin n=1 Tax=Anaerocolumna sp. AGMB13025 TaxID=3039116 RepID=UPI00242049A4|nr:ferredoxin [Anaerocolumna sp. AGMB13025]WFR55289.1 ferredoxin [Anaerocolumna sp. AGMB13025]
MKAVIAKKGCIGCGLCTDICPSVFRMTNKAYAEVYVDEIAVKDKKNANEAKENCPSSVISISE